MRVQGSSGDSRLKRGGTGVLVLVRKAIKVLDRLADFDGTGTIVQPLSPRITKRPFARFSRKLHKSKRQILEFKVAFRSPCSNVSRCSCNRPADWCNPD